MQKTGYTFIGWSVSKTATAPDWVPGATSLTAFGYANENEAVSKTLYAVWEQDTSTPTIIDTLNSITSFLGLLNKSSTPSSSEYDSASLVEKVNYLEDRLTTVEGNLDTVKSDVSTNKSNISTINTNLNTVKSDVSTNKSNISTINTNVNSIKNTVSSLGSSGSSGNSVIKSVQRGGVGGFNTSKGQEINISTVNPSKCIVILTYNNSGGNMYGCSYSLQSNKLTIYSSGTSTWPTSIYYQIIEFY